MMLLILISSLLFNNNSLDKKIQDYLNKHLKNYAKYEYEILSTPDTGTDIELQYNRPFNLSRNMVYIPVKIVSSNNNAVSSVISVKVRLFKKIFVANQNIKPRTELDASMFDTRVLDITSVRGTAVDKYENVVGMRAKSIINRGEILTEESIEAVPILFSGDEVTAVKIIGAVSITVQAYVREDGCKGDRIKIRTIDNKQFTAKVINSHEVSIEE